MAWLTQQVFFFLFFFQFSLFLKILRRWLVMQNQFVFFSPPFFLVAQIECLINEMDEIYWKLYPSTLLKILMKFMPLTKQRLAWAYHRKAPCLWLFNPKFQSYPLMSKSSQWTSKSSSSCCSPKLFVCNTMIATCHIHNQSCCIKIFK